MLLDNKRRKMNKRKKIMILTTSSLSAAGLLGMGTGAITNMVLTAHTNSNEVGAGVQLNSVITVTNLGDVY
jgi:O-antigen/teichoic acid export membrane protein